MFRLRKGSLTERERLMKIKENYPAVRYSQPLIVFAVAAVLLTVLRCFQIANDIDASTGFYKSRGFFVILFFVLLFASCLAFAVSSFLSIESRYVGIDKCKSKGFYAITLIFSLVMFFDGASSLIGAYDTAQDTRILESVFKSMMISGAIPQLLRGIFGLLSGVYFASLSGSLKKADGDTSKHKVLALMPVGWAACRLLNLFVRRISFLRVSDLFLELSMCAFMTLFFMAFAQVASHIYSDDSRWRLAGFGLPAALVAFILSVSRLIFTIIDSEKYIGEDYRFCLADLVFAVFAFALVLTLSKASPLSKTQEKEPEIVP